MLFSCYNKRKHNCLSHRETENNQPNIKCYVYKYQRLTNGENVISDDNKRIKLMSLSLNEIQQIKRLRSLRATYCVSQIEMRGKKFLL